MEDFKKEYFSFEESATNKGFYLISPKHELLSLESTSGSFNVIGARLMGLSYAQYLRMCRDIFGAEIHGKGTYYPIPYFQKDNLSRQFIKLLNGRAAVAMHHRAFPDLEQKIADLQLKIIKEKENERV